MISDEKNNSLSLSLPAPHTRSHHPPPFITFTLHLDHQNQPPPPPLSSPPLLTGSPLGHPLPSHTSPPPPDVHQRRQSHLSPPSPRARHWLFPVLYRPSSSCSCCCKDLHPAVPTAVQTLTLFLLLCGSPHCFVSAVQTLTCCSCCCTDHITVFVVLYRPPYKFFLLLYKLISHI